MVNKGMRGGGDSWKGLVTAVGETLLGNYFIDILLSWHFC